jgi:hypothetical protein
MVLPSIQLLFSRDWISSTVSAVCRTLAISVHVKSIKEKNSPNEKRRRNPEYKCRTPQWWSP